MATSIKHVQESLGTAPKVESSFTPPESPLVTFVGEKQYVIFMLVKKKQRRLTIDGICHNVKNPKTNKYETIRYIRGAHSIWTSELTEVLKDKDTVNRNRLSPRFMDGMCRVPVRDELQLDFLRHNINNVGKNRHGSGKYDFYEYDAAEEQKLRYDARMKRINLIATLSTMAEDRMTKLALFLGVKPYDDETGLPTTPDGYRTELLIKADTKTDDVLRYLDSREVEISYLVRKGISDAKIDLGGSSANVIWAGGGGFICKLPAGRKPIEYLTELAMTNSKDGTQFKGQLESIVT